MRSLHPGPSACLAILAAAILIPGSLILGGCGHHHHDDGFVVVDNRTDLTTSEDLLAFRLASFGDPFTGDLLSADLPPGSAENLGIWREDFYDGEGDLELGQLIEWFDLFVGNGDTTVFEAR
ncbi:MAG: hypothetical protein QNJ90_06010 [Planctomycetota bacterium]|nr:hypothetical protein [Planctomycetota bacterium]